MSTMLTPHILLPAIVEGADPLDLGGTTGRMGIHACSTSKAFVCGQRLIKPDGRLFKYCLATTGGVDGYHGCMSLADDVIGEVLTVGAAIGDTQFRITEVGFTKNQLEGAYVFIYDASGGGQFRYVTGNEASDATYTLCYVSEPFDQTIAGTEYCEMFENPYSLCTKTATGKACVIAIPACTAAASYYFWGQTWGPCVVSPGETIVPSGDIRQVVFGSNGAIFLETTHSDYQTAGFIMNYNSDNGPLLMLQISV